MGETVAEAGWMGQDERRGALRAGRGGGRCTMRI